MRSSRALLLIVLAVSLVSPKRSCARPRIGPGTQLSGPGDFATART